jgi:protein-S-isoprenylcysteine O-methyltransferase Ste14
MMDLPLRKMIDVPPVWLALFLALAWLQGSYLPVGPAPGGLGRVLGWGLILGALVLIGLAAREFRRHRTTVVPHMPPEALVTSGVFALSRNPIYLADAMILAGCALLWQAWPSLILVPVFMWLIARRFILAEEARLRAAFGAQFDAYARNVRCWL